MQPSNTYTEFVGVERLTEFHKQQVEQFSEFASNRSWESFHIAHYDWWAFPIDKPSQHGFAFTVFQEEIAALKSDPEFMRLHSLGAELLLLSWGWDWQASTTVESPDSGQSWADWPIRLAKCSRSMWLFGLDGHWKSCVTYAEYLAERGASFQYSGRDLFEEIKNPDLF